MSNYLTLDQCKDNIAKIRGNAATLQALIHETAVSSLAHIAKCGDHTVAASLLNALPSGQRVQQLSKWFKVYSGNQFAFTRDKKAGNVFAGKKVVDTWTADKFDLEGAKATTFGDMEDEKVASTMTLDKLRALVAKIANNRDVNPDGSRKVPDNVVAMASFMVCQFDDKRAAKAA